MKTLLATIGFLACSIVHAAPIDDLAWIAGCWRGQAGDRAFEEQWMAPKGGLMLGNGRTTQGDRVTGYEQMRIEQQGDQLAFVSKPSTKPEARFPAKTIDANGVVFEDLMHPYPQRIIYRKGPGDTLAARIEGNNGREILNIDFPMHRVSCS